MERPLFLLYPLPWWRSRRVGVAALLIAVVLATWLAWPADGDLVAPVHEPVRVKAARPASATTSSLDAPAAPASPIAVAQRDETSSLPATRPPLSIQIAPGVHITPLSVPPGTTPEPAGPRDGDSEPEN
jgi:hypothetical protein